MSTDSTLWVLPWIDGLFERLSTCNPDDEQKIVLDANDTFTGMTAVAKKTAFIYLLGLKVRKEKDFQS